MTDTRGNGSLEIDDSMASEYSNTLAPSQWRRAIEGDSIHMDAGEAGTMTMNAWGWVFEIECTLHRHALLFPEASMGGAHLGCEGPSTLNPVHAASTAMR